MEMHWEREMALLSVGEVGREKPALDLLTLWTVEGQAEKTAVLATRAQLPCGRDGLRDTQPARFL